MERRSFWLAALLWLPVGVVASAVLRFGVGTGPAGDAGMWAAALVAMAGSLVPVAPCGLPLALGCRRLWRLGPIAIALYATVLSVPVWIAWWWMARRG